MTEQCTSFSMRGSSSMIITLLLLVALTLFPAVAEAWSCTGHMLVAAVARRHMHPAALRRAEQMAERFAESGGFSQSSPDLAQLACWADDLRGWGQTAMAGWHYKDVPYNPLNMSLPSNATPSASEVTVTTALGHMAAALSRALPRDNKSAAPFFSSAFALANYVHLMGDVHQPLHAASRFTPHYPQGDFGGNLVLVRVASEKATGGASTAAVTATAGRQYKLHALWDEQCLSPFNLKLTRPLSEEQQALLASAAAELDGMYGGSFSPRLKALTSAPDILAESRTFAVNTTYAGIPLERVEHLLTPEYLQTCRSVCEQRLTLAGYRLAHALNAKFSTEGDEEAGDGHKDGKSDRDEGDRTGDTDKSQPRSFTVVVLLVVLQGAVVAGVVAFFLVYW